MRYRGRHVVVFLGFFFPIHLLVYKSINIYRKNNIVNIPHTYSINVIYYIQFYLEKIFARFIGLCHAMELSGIPNK
jgi:hypothetical protein